MSETPTAAQYAACRELIAYIKTKYSIQSIARHKDRMATSCPGTNFDIGKATSGGSTPTPAPAPTPTPTPAPSGKLTTVKQVQAYVGTTQDGIFGPNTKRAIVKKVQKIVGTTQDGYWGPNSSAKWGKRLVMQGTSGELTKLCQMMLICRGYGLPTYGADGHFGNESEKQTKAYQKAVGLSVDGIIGKNTAYKLFV